MKILSVVGLLFCIVMFMGCEEKEEEKETKTELSEECKALEILNSGLEETTSCIRDKLLFRTTEAEFTKLQNSCDNFVIHAKVAVLALEAQGEIEEGFFDNFQKKTKVCTSKYDTIAGYHPPYGVKLSSTQIVSQSLQCWKELWNNVHPELKTQYNCD